MIANKYHVERRFRGRDIVIDLAKLPDRDGGFYEVMALDKRGVELDCVRSIDFDDAVRAFNLMLKKFPAGDAPLSGKYAKLRDDLRGALDAGIAAEGLSPDDGGACNFDSTIIFLPRWKSELVKKAAEEAGTRCFRWDKGYIFPPLTGGQGFKRTANAEAMTKAMKGCGYDAFTRYMMD